MSSSISQLSKRGCDKSDILVISPSGNLYGSERVLLDYLQQTSLRLTVAVPSGSLIYQTLSQEKLLHHITTFQPASLLRFYSRIFIWLIRGKIKSVYINEAAHSRYLNILARIFPSKKFIVHLRILEDTKRDRWPKKLPSNLSVICISKFIASQFSHNSELIYDGYKFSDIDQANTSSTHCLKIAVIGRITKSKGLDILCSLIKRLLNDHPAVTYHFYLFGEKSQVATDQPLIRFLENQTCISFNGFQNNKKEIYPLIDCVLHCAKFEPLGRIFLEAIDFHKPFLGIKAGGIGEIGQMLHLTEFLVDEQDNENLVTALIAKILSLLDRSTLQPGQLITSKRKARNIFSIEKYASTMDKILAC